MFNTKLQHVILISLPILLALNSCNEFSTALETRNVGVTYRELDFPFEIYHTLIWLPDEGLIAISINVNQSSEQQVKFAFEGDNVLQAIPFISDPSCHLFTRYSPLRLLPDGRIGVHKFCGQNDPRQDALFLLAYDWSTRGIEQIVASPLPDVLAKDYTWNPDMTRGVQEIYDVLNGTLFWISPQGVEPMRLTLSDGKRSWSLYDAYPDFPNAKHHGIATAPTWSPNGKTIAFWASFDAIGRDGHLRANTEYSLIFLDPEDMSYSIVINNIYHPGSLAWSPNGDMLAFEGRMGLFGENGLWLLLPTTKKPVHIAGGEFYDIPVWSSDGSKIAVIYCYEILCDKQSIIEYDLTRINLDER
jgi:hypothetical protein